MGRVGSRIGTVGSHAAPLGRIGSPSLSQMDVVGFGAMTAQEPALRGRSVTLRPLTDADFDQWRAVYERNAGRLRAAGATAPDDAASAAGSAEAFRHVLDVHEQVRAYGVAYELGVFRGDRFIGEASIDGIVGGTLCSGTVGVWIDHREEGTGAGIEAFAQLCRLAFDELGLHRLEAPTLPDNEAARAGLARLGIRDEGVAQRYRLVDGAWRDHVRYAITAEEWAERRDEILAL